VDAKGGRIMRDTSRENVKKRMAILLFEKGKGEVLTAPVIQGELGNRFQISGDDRPKPTTWRCCCAPARWPRPWKSSRNAPSARRWAPRTSPRAFHSVMWGFAVIVAFMALYYMLFGVFSGIALAVNLLLLVAILSMLQATLTLPGMAAMALALGMAIDSNVLINERVREELRNGGARRRRPSMRV
jgi:preprotein translocase subunit SecD